ncbi:MAG: NAD(P)H-binding protein [Myxococcota bacterium]
MSKRILLTGAAGFVGSYVYPALQAAGYTVRCATRNLARALRKHPDREWVYCELNDPSSLAAAMDGCESAVYLVHCIGTCEDYPQREAVGARNFVEAAERAGVRRVVYLGGAKPRGLASRHLRARLNTGSILRSGAVSTIELRAAMIIGAGSASWRMVCDLAARLPVMILPRWLGNYSYPISIDDVVRALLISLDLSTAESAVFELPGPECLTHSEVLERTAILMGNRPRLIPVPILTPRLSSYWIGLVTSADLEVARELVEGLKYDLLPSAPSIWGQVPGYGPMPVTDAMTLAMADARAENIPSLGATSRMARAAAADVLAS